MRCKRSWLPTALHAIAVSLCLAVSTGGAHAAAPASAGFPAKLALTPVVRGLKQPTSIVSARDGSKRLFVLEQPGRIRIIRNGALDPVPFLDITALVKSGGERGLLGLAFPPDFASSKTFYVDYTDRTGIGNTVIASFKVGDRPDRADPASRKQLLTIVQPYANHNGGQLAFGPDGLLYIGMGDGGSGGDPHGNGQRLDTLLGKILRIDVTSDPSRYRLPKNPFGNEIWALGLRNPWRFSFDRGTGDLYIADVGQDEVEEIDFQPAGSGAGANYGWNIMEGDRCFKKPDCKQSGLTLPVAVYRHGKGDCSVTGGYVYRGKSEALHGTYLYGDFCSGRIWGLRRVGGTWQVKLLVDTPYAISTFGEDEDGELYLADYGSGTIYRIVVP
ncbi:PQQ-dependent sugar dehydrogenase [Geomonas anaerohicana]|uniref:PQQ-dependent sugar dehydrogenase n=1 Tax=Geomonas anaerohicana TaxID=2798583 RepID=A0ABS0YA78_9BACT|nr:PQQ-dependent sugar dehydrogenase [Geomonas anaerohicana]MBJ6749228.1 PQQ-dependent sugar dehydrogenase [Geomonas anaerohicana]